MVKVTGLYGLCHDDVKDGDEHIDYKDTLGL